MRFNRGLVEKAVEAAKRSIARSGGVRCVWATANGFTFASDPPPFRQDYIRVASDREPEVIRPRRHIDD